MRWLLVGCAAALAAWHGEAWGQAEAFRAEGTLVGPAPLAVLVRTEQGDLMASYDPRRVEGNVQYQGLPECTFEVTGEAQVESLVRGLVVRFSVEFDKGKQVGEVDEVTILGTALPPGTPVGLAPDGIPDAPAEGEESRPMRRGPLQGKYLAVGQITKVSRVSLTIRHPAGETTARLADEARVSIQARDLSLARPGDGVSLEGVLVARGKVMATRIAVTKKAAPRDEPRRPPVRPAVGDKKGAEAAVPGAFEVGDPREAPVDAPAGPQRPREKGKVVRIN